MHEAHSQRVKSLPVSSGKDENRASEGERKAIAQGSGASESPVEETLAIGGTYDCFSVDDGL